MFLCEMGFSILCSYEHQKPYVYIECKQLAFIKYVLKKYKTQYLFKLDL